MWHIMGNQRQQRYSYGVFPDMDNNIYNMAANVWALSCSEGFWMIDFDEFEDFRRKARNVVITLIVAVATWGLLSWWFFS